VPWDAAGAVLAAAGGSGGDLAGIPIIDPTNPVEHGVGVVLGPTGGSNAERIAAAAPGGLVVKGFHLVPSTQWGAAGTATTVALCGDDPDALRVVETLVRDAGAEPFVVGSLARARQLEEVAGLFITLAFAGVDPRTVAPGLPPVRS
jgi:predicted dinucleotide-binding enzyme